MSLLNSALISLTTRGVCSVLLGVLATSASNGHVLLDR
jgi:hypothetical protein